MHAYFHPPSLIHACISLASQISMHAYFYPPSFIHACIFWSANINACIFLPPLFYPCMHLLVCKYQCMHNDGNLFYPCMHNMETSFIHACIMHGRKKNAWMPYLSMHGWKKALFIHACIIFWPCMHILGYFGGVGQNQCMDIVTKKIKSMHG